MKKRLILILIFVIVLLYATSCEMTTPTPDFLISSQDPLAFSIDASTTWLNITSITIENISDVDINVTGYLIRFVDPNGNSFDVWPSSETPMSLQMYVPGKSIVDGIETTYTGILENFQAPINDATAGIDIYNTMINNNWDTATMRVYITCEDAYGYDKEITKTVDFGLVITAK